MNERRYESRFLCADLVKVEWKPSGRPGIGNSFETVEAVLEDISALGACVQVEDRIPAGSEISISVVPRAHEEHDTKQAPAGETITFTGRVSHCVYRDYGYFVGIRFSDQTKWSSGDFEPQHLTNLEALMLPPHPVRSF